MNLSNEFNINPTYSNSNPQSSSFLKYHYFWRCFEFFYAAMKFLSNTQTTLFSMSFQTYTNKVFLFKCIRRKCGSWKLTVTTKFRNDKATAKNCKIFLLLLVLLLVQNQQNWWLRSNYMNFLEESWNFYLRFIYLVIQIMVLTLNIIQLSCMQNSSRRHPTKNY